MSLPNIHITISSNVVAFYGAVLASITATVQLANFLKDRVRVKVQVQHDMQVVGDPMRDPEETMILITITNVGRRPVTITTVGALRLFPNRTHYVFPDVIPQLPRELTEGKYIQAFVKQDGFDLSNISTWEAYTSIGKTFKLPEAPWYKRWPSTLRWRWYLKQKAKQKLADGQGTGDNTKPTSR